MSTTTKNKYHSTNNIRTLEYKKVLEQSKRLSISQRRYLIGDIKILNELDSRFEEYDKSEVVNNSE